MFNYTPSAAYPGSDALIVELMRDGIFDTSPTDLQMLFDLDGAIAGAVSEFEQLTLWRPFLAGAADQTKYFDLNDSNGGAYGYGSSYGYGFGYGERPLDGGLLSVTSVVMGTTTLTTAQPIPQAYFLPVNAPLEGLPYTRIRFQSIGFTGVGPTPLAITGKWGYCSLLPADVWNAILGRAAMTVAPGLSIAQRGKLQSWTDGGVTESYVQKPYSDAIEQWGNQFSRAVVRYKRPRLA